MTSKDSGCLQVNDGTLSYRSKLFGSWELPVSNLTLIGEYTTAEGPFVDDYFLVFFSGNEPDWHEASFYAEGRDEVLKELSVLLGSNISCGLVNSTSFNSRVLWPEERKGQRLFDFEPDGWFRIRLVLATESAGNSGRDSNHDDSANA